MFHMKKLMKHNNEISPNFFIYLKYILPPLSTLLSYDT